MVVVYPEVTSGNPLNAKRIVRWVMNEPGHFGVGDKVFGEHEVIASYKKQFDKSIKNKIDCYLELPILDEDLFSYDPSLLKTDITIYVGKAKNPDFSIIPHYDNILTRTSPTREELVKIIRKTKVLYSFDNTTAIINEARFAGCNVVLIPDGTVTCDDLKNDTFGEFGIQWFNGKNEIIDYSSIHKYMVEKLNKLNNQYQDQLANLISIVKERYDK